MPTYDYKCNACGHTFDELQTFSEPPLTKCPACKKNKLERLFGGGGAIIFKGSGFYETDYRRADQSNGNGKAEGEAAKTESSKGESSKSESSDAACGTCGATAEPGESKPACAAKKKGK